MGTAITKAKSFKFSVLVLLACQMRCLESFQDAVKVYQSDGYETAMSKIRPLAEQVDGRVEFVLGFIWDAVAHRHCVMLEAGGWSLGLLAWQICAKLADKLSQLTSDF